MAKLRQMLEEKKKQAKNMLEDISSVESEFGSQGDREGDVDMEFLPGIGSRLNRNANVNLWHKQTLQIESLKSKIILLIKPSSPEMGPNKRMALRSREAKNA